MKYDPETIEQIESVIRNKGGDVKLSDGTTIKVQVVPPPRPPRRNDYTREELVALCERAVVAHDQWSDRDSARAHVQLGQLWALLKAGCDFHINKVDDRTGMLDIWVTWRGFQWFEGTGDPAEYRRDELMEDDTFYMPGEERLNDMDGKDWYC